jgi:SAM-dependent methyltransferase
MFKPKKAKDILNSPAFMAQREKTARYVHHEFQDYAYRLASDLGDIGHKTIYMRLAKAENRVMLEQAAAFAMGYFKEINKGKIFMWKLQQLKAEQKRKQDMQNIEHDFVMQRMKSTYAELVDVFSAKQKSLFNQERENSLSEFAQAVFSSHEIPRKSKKLKILDLECGIGLDSRYLDQLGFKVSGIDISPVLSKRAKAICPNCNIISKPSFLQTKYKNQEFAGIWSKIWPLVPLEAELDYLNEFRRILSVNGVLTLEVILAASSQQAWQQFDIQKDSYIWFEKVNTEEVLIPQLETFGFKLLKKTHIEKQRYALLLAS